MLTDELKILIAQINPTMGNLEGNRDLRRLLYMGALGGVRGNNPLRPFYHQLVARGKAKKLALVAAARKILVWAWTLFIRKTQWNPSRFPAQPEPA